MQFPVLLKKKIIKDEIPSQNTHEQTLMFNLVSLVLDSLQKLNKFINKCDRSVRGANECTLKAMIHFAVGCSRPRDILFLCSFCFSSIYIVLQWRSQV